MAEATSLAAPPAVANQRTPAALIVMALVLALYMLLASAARE